MTAAITLLVLLPLALAGPAHAGDINQAGLLPKNEYWAFALYPPGDTDWRIDVQWTSSYSIDGWIITKEDYLQYTTGGQIHPLAAAFGSTGHLNYDVAIDRNGAAPFYLLLDNTNSGRATPPWYDASANVTLSGSTLATNTILGVHPRSAMGAFLFLALPFFVVVGALAVYVRRRGGLRVMISRPGSAPAAVAAPAYTAPSPMPVAPAAAPAPASGGGAGRFCTKCGAAVTGAFCNACGAPAG